MAFIGCWKCCRKKKDCKCSWGDFHIIHKRNWNYWKFELVENACGKEITTSRIDRDDATCCGDIVFEDIELCKECKKKFAKDELSDRGEKQ